MPDIDFANPLEGASQQAETSEQTQEQSQFEILRGDDGSERVAVPKDVYEEMRKGNMRNEDYTLQKMTLSEIAKALDKAQEDDEEDITESIVAESEDEDPNLPVYREIAQMKVEKESRDFKESHPFLFNGDKERDEAILAQVIQTSVRYRQADGKPISLDDAFALAIAPNISGLIQKQNPAEQQNPQKPWSTESRSVTSVPKKAIRSTEEAAEESARLIAERLGTFT